MVNAHRGKSPSRPRIARSQPATRASRRCRICSRRTVWLGALALPHSGQTGPTLLVRLYPQLAQCRSKILRPRRARFARRMPSMSIATAAQRSNRSASRSRMCLRSVLIGVLPAEGAISLESHYKVLQDQGDLVEEPGDDCADDSKARHGYSSSWQERSSRR